MCMVWVSYSAVRVSTDSAVTNVVNVRLITMTSVSAIHFLDGVYSMATVHVSNFLIFLKYESYLKQ